MYIEQIYTSCLAEAAYYIESDGEAAIIDPLRETDPYIEKAISRQAKIKYVFETHFHADFVSGHLDIARKTGATIVFGPGAKTKYSIYEGRDGEIFQLGKIKIKLLHTPGHTLESSTFLLVNEKGKNYALFTGDTLFIGDVGRPDLAIGNGLTENDLAGMLYESLHQKILPLEDDLIVYPAHGAGSSCGKNLSKETSDTLGGQKKFNYALQLMPKGEFVSRVIDGISPPPQYFFKDAMINKNGYEPMEEVLLKSLKPLSAEVVESAIKNGVLVLDTRHPQVFNKGFIPGSVNIGLGGMFAIWVGTMIPDVNREIIIVAEEGKEKESIMRLSRVGFDRVIGFLHGGIDQWEKSSRNTDTINSVTADEFSKSQNPSYTILDVRKVDEYAVNHLEGALNFPLDFINDKLSGLDKNGNYYVHCKSGYRSMIASSILRKNGFKNLVEIAGGFEAIKKTGLSLLSGVSNV